MDTSETQSFRASWSISTRSEDPEWDRFVESQPWGRHEQTSLWGQVKGRSGWNAVRMIAHGDRGIVGGFQMLHKHMAGPARIGYVSHGPLVSPDALEVARQAGEMVVSAMRQSRVNALVQQSPRESEGVTQSLRQSGFLLLRTRKIVDTTAELNLAKSEEDLLAGMRRSRRKHIKKAMKGPLQFSEGSRQDLPVFFELMQASCRRQGVAPNPGDLDSVQAMWDLYAPKGWLKLYMVTHEGRPITCLLTIPFGERFWFWKVGWSGEHADLLPNDFLHWNLIRTIRRDGYRYCDFLSIDRHAAAIIASADEGAKKTPSSFKLGFGPDIVELPPPLVCFRPAFLNRMYRVYGWYRGRRAAGRST